MTNTDISTLQKELDLFRQEKEKIRTIMGQIGGKASAKQDSIINILFLIILSILLGIDLLRYLLNVHIALPPLFSLQLGVLLVSIKIIWMIHRQTKVEHFQFWILNSIEFRLNNVYTKMQKIEKQLEHKI